MSWASTVGSTLTIFMKKVGSDSFTSAILLAAVAPAAKTIQQSSNLGKTAAVKSVSSNSSKSSLNGNNHTSGVHHSSNGHSNGTNGNSRDAINVELQQENLRLVTEVINFFCLCHHLN